MSIFRWTGIILSAIAGGISVYEFFALITPLPTISRMTQGLRDAGHVNLVFFISIVLVCVFAVFGAWLYYHLNYQLRSGN